MTVEYAVEPARCAALIRNATAIVALTGAGLSTAAGIPDFRGPQGLYVTRRYDPAKVFEIDWFLREPSYFYQFSSDFVAALQDIRPTATHRFLAMLERQGLLSAIVTQNIDLLHQQSGSCAVTELHGSYASATCTGCARKYRDLTYHWWLDSMSQSSTPPVSRCSFCSGVLKPDIVFFGEPVNDFECAEQQIAGCDLLLVLGSSLQVAPASFLPYRSDATTLVVNRGDVALSQAANRYFVEAELDDYFVRVANCLHPG